MPTTDYTSPGSYSWITPFATRNVTATCIGGGGSGFKDCTDDDLGGGGGGGGFAKSTRTVGGGITISIQVGQGGQQLPCNDRSGGDGGASSATGGLLSVRATGGEAGFDNSGGGDAGGGSAGDIIRSGQRGVDDDQGGEGGGAGNLNGNSGRCSGTRTGGRGTNLDGSAGSCTGGRNGGTYGGGGGGNNNNDGGRGGNGAVRIEWDYYAPVITSFTGSTQTSSNGTPSDTVLLSWATQYANSVSINNGIGSVTATGSNPNIDSNLQSVAGSNSPASRTYTLTASGPGGTVTATATVFVYNDNTPSNSWTTSFINLESNTQYVVPLNALSGVDMPTIGTTSGDGNFLGKSINGPFGTSLTFNNNEAVYLKFTSMPFNTDISGVTGNFGKTNSKTIPVTIGTQSFTVTVTTRAPRIAEDFNYADNKNQYPFEDIDLIANSPTQYLTSAVLTADDVEIPVEFKSDNPNIQIKINNGSWQNVGQI